MINNNYVFQYHNHNAERLQCPVLPVGVRVTKSAWCLVLGAWCLVRLSAFRTANNIPLPRYRQILFTFEANVGWSIILVLVLVQQCNNCSLHMPITRTNLPIEWPIFPIGLPAAPHCRFAQPCLLRLCPLPFALCFSKLFQTFRMIPGHVQ